MGTLEKQSIAAATELEAVLFGLNKQYQNLLGQIGEDASEGRDEVARGNLEVLLSLAKCRRATRDTSAMLNGIGKKRFFVCGSWFLRECLQKLTKTRQEAMCYVTGIQLGRFSTLDKELDLQYARQSEIFVAADARSNISALRELQENGQRLQAWFHSHPGHGPGATNPSSIDMDHQSGLEQGGYNAIGAIFVRDGYVRFFSWQLEFEVFALGKKVEYVDEKVFKIL